MQDWREVFDLWRKPSHRWIGVSDSLLSLHLGEIIQVVEPRILIINRPIKDVEDSLEALNLGVKTNLCDIMLQRLGPHRNHPSVREVEFSELSEESSVNTVIAHLMPGSTIDQDKLAEIMHINCQEDMSRIRELSQKANLPGAFGQEILSQLRMKPATQ